MEQVLPDVKQQLTQLRNQLEEVSEEVYNRGEVRNSCTMCTLYSPLYRTALR